MGAAQLQRFLAGVYQPAIAEITRRQPAELIGQIGDHRRAEHAECLGGRIFAQQLAVIAHPAHDLLTVMESRHLVHVDDDSLDLLAAHHRADAASRGDSHGPAFRIGK